MRQTFRWDRPGTTEPSRNNGDRAKPATPRSHSSRWGRRPLLFAKLLFVSLNLELKTLRGQFMKPREPQTDVAERRVWELRCDGWSLSEIARHLGCSHSYADRLWNRQVERERAAGNEIPPLWKRSKRDGNHRLPTAQTNLRKMNISAPVCQPVQQNAKTCLVKPTSLYLAGEVVSVAMEAADSDLVTVRTRRGSVWQLPRAYLAPVTERESEGLHHGH